jgi:hypothetical protein
MRVRSDAAVQKRKDYYPAESFTHFFVKLVFAAPASFLSAACASQDFAASLWHFLMKLFAAAPASFFSPAWAAQLGLCANALPAVDRSSRCQAAAGNEPLGLA